MPSTLTESQLKSALTNEQLQAAKTKGVGTGETLDPVAEEIAAACAKVDAYTTGYVVNEFLLTGYARDIAAHQVAKRLDTPTEAQVRAYDRALKELEDIRDGKFPHLEKTTEAAEGKLASGSRTKII